MLHDVVQRKKFYTLVLQKCLTRLSNIYIKNLCQFGIKTKIRSELNYNFLRSERMYRRIRDLREDCDYSQEYLARYLSCSQSAYSKIESGKRQIPVDFLIKISELYQVSTDYLLGLTDTPYRLKNKK